MNEEHPLFQLAMAIGKGLVERTNTRVSYHDHLPHTDHFKLSVKQRVSEYYRPLGYLNVYSDFVLIEIWYTVSDRFYIGDPLFFEKLTEYYNTVLIPFTDSRSHNASSGVADSEHNIIYSTYEEIRKKFNNGEDTRATRS